MANEGESHPLKYKLQFWMTQARYSANDGSFVQTAVGPVLDTVELFYQMYNTLHEYTPFDKIKEGGYSLFKERLKPSIESFPRVCRNICQFQCNQESYLNLFLLLVSGKFDNLYGIYTQKHPDKDWKIEIWSNGPIDIDAIKNFFGESIPSFSVMQKKKKY